MKGIILTDYLTDYTVRKDKVWNLSVCLEHAWLYSSKYSDPYVLSTHTHKLLTFIRIHSYKEFNTRDRNSIRNHDCRRNKQLSFLGSK